MPDTQELLKKYHVLIVDDDPAFLGVLEGMLKSIGIGTVSKALSGSEALDALAKPDRLVDVIICDYEMSSGNGLQLLQTVRLGKVKNLRPDVCFLLLTVWAKPDVVTTAAHLDAHGYLVKPVTPEKLLAAILKGRAKHFPIRFDRYAGVTLPDTD